MLLTVTNTRPPATDLGWLLHKNPAKFQSFDLAFGPAHVFYPEASEQRCTAALLVDIDPVGLVRNRRGPAGESRPLEQYVNDRAYAASSFLSTAIAQVFATALAGRCNTRPELPETVMTLRAELPVLPCRGGAEFLGRLFDPLGYAVEARRLALDDSFPDWGDGPYFRVTLSAETRLRDLLSHLYVLIPVLDDDKHYWVGQDEADKLLRHGEGWLAGHPERERITARYLKHRAGLSRQVLQRLSEDDPQPDDDDEAPAGDETVEPAIAADGSPTEAAPSPGDGTATVADGARPSLNEQRLGAVLAELRASGAKRLLDLGCGEGKLLRRLVADRAFGEIVGVDVSHRALEIAGERLHLDRLPEGQRGRVRLIQGSLTYRDKRLAGFDAAAVVEVVEHLDPPRLAAFERVLFEFARPGTVVLTTPNAEFNVKYEGLPAGRFRHRDHRFEWTRAEFASWTAGVAGRFGYAVRTVPVGAEDALVGPPTQMAVFTRVR